MRRAPERRSVRCRPFGAYSDQRAATPERSITRSPRRPPSRAPAGGAAAGGAAGVGGANGGLGLEGGDVGAAVGARQGAAVGFDLAPAGRAARARLPGRVDGDVAGLDRVAARAFEEAAVEGEAAADP